MNTTKIIRSLYINTMVNNYILAIKDDNDVILGSYILHEPDLEVMPLLKVLFKNNNNNTLDLFPIVKNIIKDNCSPFLDCSLITPYHINSSFKIILDYLYNVESTNENYFDEDVTNDEGNDKTSHDDNDVTSHSNYHHNNKYNLVFFLMDMLCIQPLWFIHDVVIHDMDIIYPDEDIESFIDNEVSMYKETGKSLLVYSNDETASLKENGLYALSFMSDWIKVWSSLYDMINIENGQTFSIGYPELQNVHLDNYAIICKGEIFIIHNTILGENKLNNNFKNNDQGKYDTRIAKYFEIEEDKILPKVINSVICSVNDWTYWEAERNAEYKCAQYWVLELIGSNDNCYTDYLDGSIFIGACESVEYNVNDVIYDFYYDEPKNANEKSIFLDHILSSIIKTFEFNDDKCDNIDKIISQLNRIEVKDIVRRLYFIVHHIIERFIIPSQLEQVVIVKRNIKYIVECLRKKGYFYYAFGLHNT